MATPPAHVSSTGTLNKFVLYNLSFHQSLPDNWRNQDPIQASILATSSTPILTNPEDYYATILRLVLPLSYLPLCRFDVQYPIANQAAVNLGAGSFTLSGDFGAGVIFSAETFLNFVPETPYPAPTIPAGGVAKPPASPYWFIYSYQHMVNLWNAAILRAWTLPLVDGGLAQPALDAPFFNYDCETQLISLYMKKTDQCDIYFNNVMERYLRPFQYNKLTLTSSANGRDNIFVMNTSTPLGTRDIDGTDYLVSTYEYAGLSAWSVIRDVTIESSLPMQGEMYYVDPSTNSRNATMVYSQTLTDLVPDISNGVSEAGLSQSTYIYNAPSLTRMFALTGKSAITQINVTVFFIDDQGNRYPLYTPRNETITIKMGFYHKSLFNGNEKDEDAAAGQKRRRIEGSGSTAFFGATAFM